MAEAVARDKVRDPVECTDKDNDLLMHKGKDMDMFPVGTGFHVLYGRVDIQEQIRAIATSVAELARLVSIYIYFEGSRVACLASRGRRACSPSWEELPGVESELLPMIKQPFCTSGFPTITKDGIVKGKLN
ncbi:hypothetical protein Syun_006975 [Stephania yunnanensis]|uniref:Uncharacterized protein n=1 Tax=Stephania yunnanensis TaxID=152371 RepID=A0AAP0L124_9MAGN